MRMGYLWLLLASLLTACQHPGPNRFDPRANSTNSFTTNLQTQAVSTTNRIAANLLRPSTNFFTLGPGDKLEIEILEDINTRTASTVAPDGKLYFSFLPGVDVWGLTLSEAREALQKEVNKFGTDERVSLTLRAIESKKVWILGRIQNPGVYPIAGPTTLLEAISYAGGTAVFSAGGQDLMAYNPTEEVADLKRSFVMRRGKVLPVDFERLLLHGDLSQNIYLEPDDFIYLPSSTAREVYVFGAVNLPRAVPFMEGMTVAGAIAAAYGTARDGYLTHVAVVRGSVTHPEIAIVDYRSIAKGRQPDVVLQPKDIVYVPYAPYRILTRYAEMIARTFLQSVAINEGSRMVTGSQAGGTQPGVVIPLGSGITIHPPPPITPVR